MIIVCETNKIIYSFVSSDAMGTDGLSEAKEKFIAKGFIREPADIFRIERYKMKSLKWKVLGKSLIITDSFNK